MHGCLTETRQDSGTSQSTVGLHEKHDYYLIGTTVSVLRLQLDVHFLAMVQVIPSIRSGLLAR
jgi:hypothetical protein